MKGMAAGVVLLSISAASAAQTPIRCQDAPGHEQGAHWSWREIDGKRCWFLHAGGAMPPKSAFTWAKDETAPKPAQEAASKPAQEVSLAREGHRTAATIQILRVKAEEMSDVQANWLDDAPVDLTVNKDLAGPFGVGGSWVVPPYAPTTIETTSFATRSAPGR